MRENAPWTGVVPGYALDLVAERESANHREWTFFADKEDAKVSLNRTGAGDDHRLSGMKWAWLAPLQRATLADVGPC